MKVDLAAARQVLLELSEDDLRRFDLTVERLMMPQSQIRSQICRLLSALAQETGQCFQLGKDARIDVLPDLYGGCLLIVSDCIRKETLDLPCAFFITEINDLIDAARAAGSHGKRVYVSLLRIDTTYLLLPERLTRRTQRLLSEYITPVYLSAASLTILREQGTMLLEHAPLSVLCGGA